MLAHRLKHWTNIESTLGERLVLAGFCDTCGLGDFPEPYPSKHEDDEKKLF